MNYADIKDVDIQDGIGVRTALYVSGCTIHCKGCHNKVAWDFNYGTRFDEAAKNRIFNNLSNSYIEGLSILGGEPFELMNQAELSLLVQEVRENFPEKSIWVWTGYQFDQKILFGDYLKYNFTKKFVDNIDIVVDGQFIEEQKMIDLKYRGSYNQRMIDVQSSIIKNEIVQLAFGDENRYAGKVITNENPLVSKYINTEIYHPIV